MRKLTSKVIDNSRTRCATITLPDARSDSIKSKTAASAPGYTDNIESLTFQPETLNNQKPATVLWTVRHRSMKPRLGNMAATVRLSHEVNIRPVAIPNTICT